MDRSVLVGKRSGALAQRLREHAELLTTALRSPENLGTFGNDLIARTLLERLCQPGGVFLDVGAHIGSVIDGVRRYSKPAKVIAVEAIPAKVTALRAKFPDVEIHGCAVGDADGELPFFIDPAHSGYSSLFQREGAAARLQEIVVPIRRLDDLLGTESPDVVKIDVEGAELAVLRGAAAVIRRARPTIMFESGPEEMGDFTKAAMWEWLDAAGYAVLIPNRVAHQDPGLSREGFLEAHLYPFRTTNYFAVARDRRDEIMLRARDILGLGPR